MESAPQPASGPDHRLRPWQRLRQRREFDRERRQGLRYECPAFLCRVLPPMDASARPARRLGVIASRKGVGGAVQRNRAKRRLREVFRLNQDALPVHCDVVIVARREVLTLDFDALTERFRDAAKRAVKRWAKEARVPETPSEP